MNSQVSGTESYQRPIRKPVAGTVVVGLQGDPLVEDTDFTVDNLTGEITFFTAPETGADVTAGYEFDVPVRFDTDSV